MKMMMEIQDISKQYKGKKILENACLSIYAHQIIALVGKNGSGKSTLLKIIAGLIDADSGAVIKHRQSLKIGYVPEVTPSHILFTPEEYLFHMGRIRGMAPKQLQQKIDDLLEMFHLQESRNSRIIHFSKGMKQKVMIMQAMLEHTDLLILDEPLSGLDSKAQSDLEETLSILKDNGLSIVLTCHETKLLQHLVDTVFVIQNNKIIQTDSFSSNHTQRNRLIFEIADPALLENLLPFLDIQQQNQVNSNHFEIVTVIKLEDTNQILEDLLRKHASIKQLMPINYQEEHFYRQF
ncbi:ABC transporter ATP-binding protein [Lysinibacillus pakistanensis]|uniref:ABC transporter ATP-binding protein n=1 Tax=Lysinibacillus pakistanensis TaxID=759811 RepID=A0AAX3WZB2_9BACI|nr:ABC transporter ATP-binding protein [Lysinibacillus pakistanensis]MDM5232481.1 ABC transporter ATP-binding protein [Lysinibacillus pakistanensis]WHY47992.1 ABC transporter ATP-binding protein [Lysinibacillus pakistanensis]WHY53004.1 ABC transporter ATP-binding protein [Lysinibacillus pakistanensis]